MGQTQFGHVTFPRSHACKVLKSRFVTDHGNLVYFTTKQKLSCRQAQWALYLSHFKFIIIHKPGAYNKADALSHHPDLKEGMVHDNEEWVLLDTKFFSACAVHATAITSQGNVLL